MGETIARISFIVALPFLLQVDAHATLTCAQASAQVIAAIPREIDPQWKNVPVTVYEIPYWDAGRLGPHSEIHLGIGDPHQQVDASNPLPLLFADTSVNQRLKLIDAQLEASNDRVKVYLDRWNTRVVKYSECPSCFSLDEVNGKARFSIVILHPLDENPQIALHGVITAQMFDCLHDLVDPKTKNRRYESSWREQMSKNLETLNQARHGDPELHRIMTRLGQDEVARQIEEVAKLQLVWGCKIEFYRSFISKHPELARGRLAPEGGQNILDKLVAANHPELDEIEIQEFINFYSRNQVQRLDPTIVRRAWNLPRPPLWEAPISMPTLVALPPPRSSIKDFEKKTGADVRHSAP